MSRFTGETVLAVLAHPDDESIACGGTLAMLADLGARVVVLCATRGEHGSTSGEGIDEALGRERAREGIAAAESLGVSDFVILDHPDGSLRWAPTAEFQAEIVMAIRRFRPAAVITFGSDGLYWHPDHIAVHELATSAVRSMGASSPPIYYVTMPREAMPGIVEAAKAGGWRQPSKGLWSLVPDAWGTGALPAEIVLDVSAWVARKVAAIRAHRSQIGDDPLALISVDDTRRWLGIEHFHRAPDIAPLSRFLEKLAGENG